MEGKEIHIQTNLRVNLNIKWDFPSRCLYTATNIRAESILHMDYKNLKFTVVLLFRHTLGDCTCTALALGRFYSLLF